MNQAIDARPVNTGERSYSSRSPSYLLSKFGLLALLAILLVAAWNGHLAIVVFLGLIISAAVIARLWSRLSLVGVSCQRFLQEQRAFPGEYIDLKLRLINRKILPLPWVQVDDELPEQLAPQGVSLTPGSRSGFRFLSNSASLLWYTGINWRYRLFCRKRGYYTLGPIVINSGDIFGFYPRSATQQITDHVIVYPRLFPIDKLGIPSLYPLGETQAARRIFEDPTRTIGVRDYSPHDSLRHVHWKASARRQHLQVKVFEPTTTLRAAIYLAVDSFQNSEDDDNDEFELGVSTAASVANYIVRQHNSVGLFANTRLPDSNLPVRILPGGDMHHLVNILEALAKVVRVPSAPFVEFVQEEWGRLPWGTTLILVISQLPEELPVLLAGLKATGYKVMVLQIGGDGRSRADLDAEWHSIRNPGDLAATLGRSV